MYRHSLPIGLAALLLCGAFGGARAGPFGPALIPERSMVIAVRLVCDPNRCIDPRTGAYTSSSCDYRGCRPSSGIVGYTNPGGSYGYGYGYGGGPGYGQEQRGYYGRGWRRDYDED
jgi:hypothetical protein